MTVVGAQSASALVALFVDAFLFHKLTKNEQGALSSGLAVAAVLLQASDLGLALTTIRLGAHYIAAGRSDLARALFRKTLVARVAFAALVIGGAALFPERISRDVLSMQNGRIVVAVAALGVFGNAIVWWGVDVAQARRAFGSYAVQQIAAALLRGLAVFAAFAWLAGNATSQSAVSILAVIAAGNLAAGIFSLSISCGALRDSGECSAPLQRNEAAHIRLFEFGAYAAVISALTALSANADVFLVQHFLGEEDTAVFACARRLAMALNLLSTAGLTVLLPRASALNSRAECADYVRKAVALGIAAAIFSAGGLALAGGIFVPIFGGPNYTASIPILRWLCVAHGIGMVLTPLMLVLYPLRREGYIVFVNALLLGANVVFGIWLTPSYGLKGAAWALIGARVLMALATGALVFRALRKQR